MTKPLPNPDRASWAWWQSLLLVSETTEASETSKTELGSIPAPLTPASIPPEPKRGPGRPKKNPS